MRQIIQNLRSGETLLEEVPAPELSKGHVLIQTTHSLVSLGTEKMLVEFGKSSLIAKARQQPDRVKQVLDKIKSDGLLPTLEAVFNKLDQPLPLGYCNVGRVIGVGAGVTEFKIGDRVASNGAHAEIVSVPVNLVAQVPAALSDEEACFTVIGSIGLQGIRLVAPTIGETVVVYGMGLIGLITAQLLKANGCRVIGIDIDAHKLALAEKWGIIPVNALQQDVVSTVLQICNGTGADAVIITASAKDNSIISQSAKMSRKRGRIVLVGVIGLDISRADFYEKELSFQVSCSYGPGRYDEQYEGKGQDYPLAYVRWTEKRNFETILQTAAQGTLQLGELVSELVDLTDYKLIYGDLGKRNTIASILKYPSTVDRSQTIHYKSVSQKASSKGLCIVGSGNFTKMTLLPALKKLQAPIHSIVSLNGLNGTLMAKKYGIPVSSTDFSAAIKDEAIDTVMITTRHHLHAKMVVESLAAGKHVFVEKPMAIEVQGLEEVIDAQLRYGKAVHVGFNRRFSPHSVAIKKYLPQGQPIHIVATMNAGLIPSTSWVHDLQVGGGRIIGEACHFIDLATYFTGSKVKSVVMNALGTHPTEQTDNASLLLQYENGSNVVINYFSNGSKQYSKERMELYFQEKTIILDNFRRTEAFGVKGLKTLTTKQDKGHAAQFERLVHIVKEGGGPLIPFDELVNTTRASFAALESLRTGKRISL